MRRRRNAASEEAEASEMLGTDPQTSPAAAESQASETQPEAKPVRRRTARKQAEEAVPESPVEPDVVPEPATTAEPDSTPPARPRRSRRSSATASDAAGGAGSDVPSQPEPTTRRRGRGAIGAAAAQGEPTAVVPVPVGPATIEPAVVVPESGESTPAETPKRRSRRRPQAEPEAEAEVIAEPASEPVESAPEGEPGSVSTGRNRRRRAGRDKSATGTPETTESAPVDDEAGVGSEPKSRTRGLRRTRTVAAPQLMVSGADEAPAVEPTDFEAETSAEAGRRTRGGRRARPVPAEPAPPPEPVRPAYVPLPAEVLNRLPEAKVVPDAGRNTLMVDGSPVLPVAFFVNTEINPDDRSVAEREIRLAYQRGIRLFTFLAHLPWPGKDGARRTEPLEGMLEFVAANAPDAKLIPRLMFAAPPAWIRRHPDDMADFGQGASDDVSMASRAFWEDDADQALRAAVEHIAQGPHAHRVVGIYLERAEWFFDRDAGYDRSRCNEAGFRRWLRHRYKGSAVALRAAWHDGAVTFDNATVPEWPVPVGYPAGLGQFLGPREQRWTDYHEYASQSVANAILGLAKAVKEASGGRSLVAVSYGYTLELPRAHSGHLALASVLDSPDIDILTGPISYSNRQPGGSAPMPAPIDSVALAGKLWISEDDTKTHLASDETSDPFNVRVSTEAGTKAVHLRNFGAALAKGTGLSWMDLWGEGWLDDRETWEFLGALRETMDTYTGSPDRAQGAGDPDVAVLVDEKSFFGVRNDELIQRMVADQRDALARSGARYGIYLQSDLVKPNFPSSAKLLIFLNAFHIEPAVRVAIRERFQNDGRTLAWVYAPGILDGPVSEVADVVGMHLKLQPWGSRVGTTVRVGTRSRLTERLPEPKFGIDRRCDPSICVVDPRAEILGEYPNGNASLAYRKHARWQSVFIGDAGLSIALLRGLYRLAGVPVYTVEDDVCWIGDGIACLHSEPGGGTRIVLPTNSALHDITYGETLASGGRGARFTIVPEGTRLLAFGSRESLMRDFEADFESAPPGFEPSEVPEVVPFVFDESVTVQERSVPEADSRLFSEAVARLNDVVKSDEAPGADEEGTGSGRSSRRRRRRRGRGGDSAELPQEVTDTIDANAEAAPERSRPTLEELLPAAVEDPEAELPPVPEELLPLDDNALADGKSPRRRRRRGRGPRGSGVEGEEVSSEPPAGESSEPETE